MRTTTLVAAVLAAVLTACSSQPGPDDGASPSPAAAATAAPSLDPEQQVAADNAAALAVPAPPLSAPPGPEAVDAADYSDQDHQAVYDAFLVLMDAVHRSRTLLRPGAKTAQDFAFLEQYLTPDLWAGLQGELQVYLDSTSNRGTGTAEGSERLRQLVVLANAGARDAGAGRSFNTFERLDPSGVFGPLEVARTQVFQSLVGKVIGAGAADITARYRTLDRSGAPDEVVCRVDFYADFTELDGQWRLADYRRTTANCGAR